MSNSGLVLDTHKCFDTGKESSVECVKTLLSF